jgi:hypothetical protein
MKIRISDQSLRIRLSRHEAEALCNEEVLTTELTLNALDQFVIELRTWHLAIGEVNSERHKLIASIPLEAAQQLASTSGYRFSNEQASNKTEPLLLEIEIDLAKEKNT